MRFTLPRLFLHHIDVLNQHYIKGWCLNRLWPGRPVVLQFFGDSEPIGQVVCNLYRRDVSKAGLHPDGLCGFTFRFPENISGRFSRLTFRVAGLSHRILDLPTAGIPAPVQTARPLFFMHIPKTAGTSLNNHLQSWFGADHWHIHTETLEQNKLEQLCQPDSYLAGHLPLYRLQSVFSDLDRLSLHALLREPLSQLHSHLAWIKGIGLNPDGAFFASHPQVVQTLARKLQSNPLQTAGQINQFVNQLDGFESDFFDNIQTRYFLESRPQTVTAKEAEQAISNTQLFDTIGLTESYSDYLQLLSTRYGRETPDQDTRHNPSKVAPLFDLNDPEIRTALTPLTEFDHQLYDSVRHNLLATGKQ